MASSSLIAFAGTLGALALGVIGPTPALGHPETPASDGAHAATAPAPDDDIPAPPPTFHASPSFGQVSDPGSPGAGIV